MPFSQGFRQVAPNGFEQRKVYVQVIGRNQSAHANAEKLGNVAGRELVKELDESVKTGS